MQVRRATKWLAFLMIMTLLTAFILASSAFVGSLGAALGPLVSGYIFDLTGSYQWAFRICFLTAAAGVILAFRLKTGRKAVPA